MSRITVRTDGGKIRIKRRDTAEAPVASGTTGAPPSVSPTRPAPAADSVLISGHLINLMEIRAESVFRPGEGDVEIVYALSGSEANRPDMLHKLSSRSVVAAATEDSVVSSVQGMLDHVAKEREGDPGVLIHIHTHPQSIPRPSQEDERVFQEMAARIAGAHPNARVLFGVHAVSSEAIRERSQPAKVSKNTVKWTSITREHEVAFYTPDSQPWKVDVDG